MNKDRKKIYSYVLILPLVLFIILFFIWPLFSMLKTSVSNESVYLAFPTTSQELKEWQGHSPIPESIKKSFVYDLQNLVGNEDKQILGRATQQLNSAASGFRSLIGKTHRYIIHNTEESIDLSSIDNRWEQERYWLAFKQVSKPITDKNLLAALDLQRNLYGDIEAMPDHTSANVSVFLRTFEIAFCVTLMCVILGVPYAMIMANTTGVWKNIMLVAVLLPLWTSLLVRSAAWVVLLQDYGPINQFFIWIGAISEPMTLIFNRSGVLIAMTQVLLPFLVLPVYNAMMGVPTNLNKAASSLGAKPFTVFTKVLFPLFKHGVFAGALLVFMTSIGYYITPALVGGAKEQMISSVIAFYAIETANWGMAAALGTVLLLVTIVLYYVYNRFERQNSRTGD